MQTSDDAMDETAAPQGDATAQAVARAAGVSRIMVSRAFNPDASIRTDKRQSILKVASALGYHPDMAARSMATGRSNLVAILVPSVANRWEAEELDLLLQHLQAQGMMGLIFRAPPQQLDSADLVQLRAYKPAAVIAFMDQLAPEDLTALCGNSPTIYPFYGSALPGPISGRVIDRLHVNQWSGISSAVRLLAGTGRRRIAYVRGTDYVRRADHSSARSADHANSVRDRYDAFTAAMRAFQLTPVAEIDGDFDYRTSRQNTGNFVRNGGQADAYFAANDVSAFGVMDALRHDLGLAVPQDCAVIGFDNIEEAAWGAYNLTTVELSIADRVTAIMRLLKARLSDPEGPPRSETITTSLVVRSSA